jgi:hypothetical protein
MLRPAVRRTGKWSAGGETQESSRSETTVGEPQAEARWSFSITQMQLVTSAFFAKRNRRGREGDGADHRPVERSRKRVGHGGMVVLVMAYNCFIDALHDALDVCLVF